MNADVGRHKVCQTLDERSQFGDTKRAVQSKAKNGIVGNADVERFECLTGQCASAAVVDGGRHHHRNGATQLVVQLTDGVECCLGVQGVEARLQ